ncbi:hypothetical protein [Fibrella aquatilis]|uniref:Uncharacterized protein n=1 Tax=Fibrella aquatilis TaxID=2817059 RepID=A0A939GDW0_9BACT|nr:hypothetical protein [Fibrella aquatilis]MBO0934608.1 hypothetical protein [Fibrella aquatilis]
MLTKDRSSYIGDGYDITTYFRVFPTDFDTADQIRATIGGAGGLITSTSTIRNANIPLRIQEAMQALVDETTYIKEVAQKSTDGAANFNATDGAVSAAAVGATFIPVVGLALGPLIGLLGNAFSGNKKKDHIAAITSDATKILQMLGSEYAKLQQLAAQYPVQTTSGKNGLVASGSGGQSNNVLLIGGLGLAAVLLSKKGKAKR